MRFLELIHRYMRILDRIRSTKEWLATNYYNEKCHIITPGSAKSSDVVQLDDKRFVENATVPSFGAWIWAAIAMFVLAATIIPGVKVLLFEAYGIGNDWPNTHPWWAIGFFTFFVSCLFIVGMPPILLSFAYLFKRPKKRQLIFDRENGTVTLPPRFWGAPEVVPFNELKVKRIRNLGSIVNFYVLAAFRPSDGQAIEFGLVQDNWKDWGFYCWYMDKNRPLPPGEVFDPYRERDAERRTASSRKAI